MDGAIKEGVELIQGKDRKNGAYLRTIAWNLFLNPLDQDLMLKAVSPKEYKKRKQNYKKKFMRVYRCTQCKEEIIRNGKKIVRETQWTDDFIPIKERRCKKCKSSNVIIKGRGGYGSGGSGNAISNSFNTWRNAEFLMYIENNYLDTQLSKEIALMEQKAISSQKKGNFTKSSQLRKEIKKAKGDLILHKSLLQFNMSPFFAFCEINNPNQAFTKEEKYILERLFLPQAVRNRLYYDYKETDFLDAIAKFYVREYYIPSLKLKNTKDNKYAKNFLNGLKLSSNSSSEHLKDIKLIVKEKLTPEEKETIKETDKFIEYIHSEDFEGSFLDFYKALHKEYPEIMNQLDNKILKLIDLA